jgi:hypothetical protein
MISYELVPPVETLQVTLGVLDQNIRINFTLMPIRLQNPVPDKVESGHVKAEKKKKL